MAGVSGATSIGIATGIRAAGNRSDPARRSIRHATTATISSSITTSTVADGPESCPRGDASRTASIPTL
jgi:hypothetical protein